MTRLLQPSILGLAALALSVLAPDSGQAQAPVQPPSISADSAASLPAFPLRRLPETLDFGGEDLLYSVRYGVFEAGEARLSVTAGPPYGGRETWRVVGTGRSTGPLDWVFRVRDHYESHIDRAGLFPHRFIRRVREGGYRLERDIDFDPARRTATTRQSGRVQHHMLPAYCQDLVSAFYYARNLPLESLRPGELVEIPTVVDGEVHTLRARFIGEDFVRVKAGRFACWRFTPVVQEGRIWKDEADLSVWVRADARRIPVLIESDLVVGSIRMELVEERLNPSGVQAAPNGP